MTPDQRDEMLIRMDERVLRLNHELLGSDGQPGRVKIAENRIDELEAGKNTAIGWIGGVGATLGVAWGALEYFFHRKP